VGDVSVERLALEVDAGVPVPLVLLLPARKPGVRLPVVTAFAQAGKGAFLQRRAGELARLLRGGVAVALPDLRGTGETRPGGGRGRTSSATALASSELMLGRTLLGARLRDLRTVLAYLRGRADLDGGRLALWGDSFAPANPPGRRLEVPLDVEGLSLAEPLGGLLALLGGLYEEGVSAVYGRGGLAGYGTLLEGPFCHVPYDVIVPGVLRTGDLADVAAELAPRPLRLEGLVDGLNRAVAARDLAGAWWPATEAYRSAGAAEGLRLEVSGEAVSAWLLARLARR
jgi:hypothetical protein